jgi:hypothetical protein
MDIGMLWFDNDKKADLRAKIARAAKYYQNKYGDTPNLCFIHPGMLPENGNGSQAGEIEVRTSNTILPHHFWIGVNQSDNGGSSQ